MSTHTHTLCLAVPDRAHLCMSPEERNAGSFSPGEVVSVWARMLPCHLPHCPPPQACLCLPEQQQQQQHEQQEQRSMRSDETKSAYRKEKKARERMEIGIIYTKLRAHMPACLCTSVISYQLIKLK